MSVPVSYAGASFLSGYPRRIRKGAFHHDMRRHTRWLYRVNYTNGTVQVGRCYNVRPKCDTIRFRHAKGDSVWWDVMVRPDEAVLMAAALIHVAGDQLHSEKGDQQKAARKSARTKKRRIGH